MNYTIDQLMEKVNCAKVPDRWREIYHAAMADFEENGCALTQPEYYDALADEYGILNTYRHVYKQAAVAIGKIPELCAFLALLCYALRDREASEKELRDFSAPTCPTGGHDIAYDMLTALAVCSVIPTCAERMRAMALPEDMISTILNEPESYIDEYTRRNGGAYGFSLLNWTQLVLNGKMFRIGRLNFQLDDSFHANVCVFENQSGEHTALADGMNLHRSGYALGAKGYETQDGAWRAEISETDAHWTGYAFDENGFVNQTPVQLPKSQWRKILCHGDPVLGVHIPAGGWFSPDIIDDSISRAKDFFAKHFPEYRYKAFFCHSWMLSPELKGILGDSSNIVRFADRFMRFGCESKGEDVFYFVFNKPFGTQIDLVSLPQGTRLERALKKHYIDGNCILEMQGCFFK